MHKTAQTVFLAGLLATPAFAGVINGSFEDGLNGWTKTGGGLVYYTTGGEGYADDELNLEVPVDHPFPVTTNSFYNDSWAARNGGVQGAQAGFIRNSGVPNAGPPPALWDITAPDGREYFISSTESKLWAGLFQDIELAAGQTLSGWAALDTGESNPGFGDLARVTVNGQEVWNATLSDVLVYDEEFGFWFVPELTWQQWAFTAPDAGTFRLQLELHVDDQEASWAWFDNIKVSAIPGVPDATSTGLILGTVFAAMAAIALAQRPSAVR